MKEKLTNRLSERRAMALPKTDKTIRDDRGFSLIQLLLVLVIMGILTAVAIPQMIAQRRLTRSIGVTRELMTQIRLARQLAMAQRQAITFQYDTTNEAINIIDHNNVDTPANPTSGIDVLSASGYPSTSGSTVLATVSLRQGGLNSGEMSWGIPTSLPGLPTTADGLAVPNISASSNKLNITFQRDGSVVDATGNPVDQVLFIYNNKVPNATASAISVRGASGRVKIWRYNNVDSYIE
ncbi:MAG TPA: prepilin-type N-terminal cleavage/methylation domain-containing protein [Pyrinomonadaceae bacterium]|nr:prepilin-type N-terminal cleavage/methylation domain-containing protein [Pyrinomonadaceae bacterium]